MKSFTGYRKESSEPRLRSPSTVIGYQRRHTQVAQQFTRRLAALAGREPAQS